MIQTRALADGIVLRAEEAGLRPRLEGHADGGWVLIDLGSVVAHVFTPGAPRDSIGAWLSEALDQREEALEA